MIGLSIYTWVRGFPFALPDSLHSRPLPIACPRRLDSGGCRLLYPSRMEEGALYEVPSQTGRRTDKTYPWTNCHGSRGFLCGHKCSRGQSRLLLSSVTRREGDATLVLTYPTAWRQDPVTTILGTGISRGALSNPRLLYTRAPMPRGWV